MIRVIRGVDRGNFTRELDAFHKMRKQVFFDTFRWDVPIINSWEIDGYDALNPIYLLSLDDAGQVVGGLRKYDIRPSCHDQRAGVADRRFAAGRLTVEKRSSRIVPVTTLLARADEVIE